MVIALVGLEKHGGNLHLGREMVRSCRFLSTLRRRHIALFQVEIDTERTVGIPGGMLQGYHATSWVFVK